MRSVYTGGLVVLLALSCASPFGGQDDVAETPTDAVDEVVEQAVEAPTTIAELGPTWETLGPADASPRKLILRFDRDVIDPEAVGPADADTVARLEPAVEGSWAWISPSRLVFAPDVGFAPSESYTATVTSLGTRWGALAGREVAHTFETPELTFSHVSRAVLSREYVDLDAIFTGPVAEGAARKLTVKAGGRTLRVTEVDSGRSERVRLRIDRSALPKGDLELQVRVAEGVVSAVDPNRSVAPTRKSLRIDTTIRPMEIRAVSMREGRDGRYVEVICHDAAAGEADYWWDRENYESYEVSERCVLGRDALASVHFEPEVAGLRIAEGQRGFRIFGDFAQGDLALSIDAGVMTEDGGVLKKAYTRKLEVEARTPRAELVARQGRYLPRGAWGNLPVQHLNTDHVKVTVRRVPPQNLVFWLSDDDESTGARTSDLVAEKTVKVKNPTDRVATTWIDVAGLVEGERDGLLEVRVDPVVPESDVDLDRLSWRERRRLEKRKGDGDVRRLVLTDLQLVAKETEREPGADWSERLHVWAMHAEQGYPMQGVVVDAVRPSGFVMGTCRTGSDGACELVLPDPAESLDDTGPIALVARKADDVTYLKFADLRTPVSEQDVGGLPWKRTTPYTASVYADRGVYRPGDTLHLGLIVRDADHSSAEADLPVEVELMDPQRRVVRKTTLALDANGVATLDHTLPAFAPTGSWRATVSIGGEEVETHALSVEEFVPERMKVNAKVPGEDALATDTREVQIDARYLFGGSAEGSPVEVTCAIEPSRFRPAKNGQYHYGPAWIGGDKAPGALRLGEVEAVLDAQGEAAAKCPGAEDGYPMTGRLVADVAVFEGGSGRATRERATAEVHPASFYIGMQGPEGDVGSGDSFDVEGILVDWEGAATKGSDEVELVFYRLEEEYGWWWWDSRGEEAYDLYLRRSEETRKRVKVGADGRFRASFTPAADGAGYLVRATAGAARTDLRLKGGKRRYAWTSGNRVDRTPRPAKPTTLEVQAPASIRAGVENTVKVTAPYGGRMLFTVETDALLSWEWVEVKAGEVSWDFTVPDFVPNVYVSAFLVKDPHLDSPEGYTPERAFGVASTRVEPVDHQLTVKLDVPDEVRSNSPLPVEIDLGKPGASATITVAAVDEGILQLTDFESPDPLKDVFARRELGIDTFETVGWSMLMPAGPSSEHGGDGSGAGGRVQPVKPVALWSGPLTADANGKAKVVLDVPQYRGKLRVMAVAAGEERMGSADAPVFVRDPLVLQTTLPRFLVQGDSFQVPVFVTNMSGKDRDIEVRLKVDDLPWPGMPADPKRPKPVSFLGADHTTVRVKNGESTTVAFQARADALVGAARFEVTVAADTLESKDTLEVPFAPAAPKSRTTEQVTLAAGKLDLAEHLDGWLPTTEQTSVWVTPNPYARAMGHLEHVVRYPYGCIEQTTSSTRPLLFVRDLVPNVMPELDDDRIDDMVRHGIDRVLAMQTPSGGFGYWPGAHEPNAWGTVYATHMLLDAKALKHDVPQDRLDDAVAWLEWMLTTGDGDEVFSRYRDDEPYAHYVLALAGKPQKARAKKLLEAYGADPRGQDAESAYLLKAALYKAGDRTWEKDLRNPDSSKLTGVRKNSWSFYSDLRRRGLTLSVYHDLFGTGDPGAEGLARLVAGGLETRSSRWYTTQELVWGITGLGKRVAAGSRDFSGVELLEDGKPLARDATTKGKKVEPRWAVPRASERDLELKVRDAGSGTLYLVMNSEGVREDAKLQTGGEGLKLTRTYHDGEGNPLDLGKIDLGDVVYTKITVKNTGGEAVQNIALVDRFASGWEIENPRLGNAGIIDWIDRDDLWDPDHMNLRDDRLELFGELKGYQTRTVVYGLRATTAGEFTSPPVEAEAMYNPDIWAREPGSTVIVKGPWEDALL